MRIEWLILVLMFTIAMLRFLGLANVRRPVGA